MVEILRWIVCHAEPLHDLAGPPIGRHGIGDDLVELQGVEAEGQRGAGALRCVTVTPVAGREAPADLHAGREVRLEGRNHQAHEARERRDPGYFYGPEGEAVVGQVRLDA